jgi:hypothetical protein
LINVVMRVRYWLKTTAFFVEEARGEQARENLRAETKEGFREECREEGFRLQAEFPAGFQEQGFQVVGLWGEWLRKQKERLPVQGLQVAVREEFPVKEVLKGLQTKD